MEVHREDYKGYAIRIEHDDDGPNPYTDYDHFGTFYHWHRRGFFGEDYSHKQSELKALLDALIEDGGVAVPVWLYEHSGQTIRAGDANPFTCPWDSGQVGFWCAAKQQIDEEFGGDTEKAIKCIKGEVSTMDDYITGNCYGYVIEKDGEHQDSCWGFLGDYNAEDGCLAEAKSIVDHMKEV